MSLEEKIEYLEEILDVDEGTLAADTILNDVEEWDSLSTLYLTVEMKKRYALNLTTETIKNFKTVGDICRYIPD